MRSRRDRKLFAMMALPLVAAVVFASLCFPVTCTAQTMAAGACPDCASAGSTHAAMPTTHGGGGGPLAACTHIIKSIVQAVETNAAAFHIDAALLGLIVETAAVIAFGAIVLSWSRPAEPPGLVFATSRLRI